ncbi:MAG: UvrD-helicase domain-containing protein [Candidatus Saccharimonadales bacterium]
MDFTTRYAKLNAAQKQAVDTIDGPVMVIAGPGTGKTELLSMRAASILKKTDTLPQNILCLTFTESGASAMRERMVQIFGKEAYKVAIHTFHSFGAEVINQNSDFFYHGATFRAADALSSYELLNGIFDELPLGSPLASKMNAEYTHLSDTLTVISELKKSGLTSDELIALLDKNDEVIAVSEPLLADAFAGGRPSKATVESLRPLVGTIRASGGAINIPSIVPL